RTAALKWDPPLLEPDQQAVTDEDSNPLVKPGRRREFQSPAVKGHARRAIFICVAQRDVILPGRLEDQETRFIGYGTTAHLPHLDRILSRNASGVLHFPPLPAADF